MNAKLLIIAACIAIAAANYAPAEVNSLGDIFETEDAIYVRVSDEEAEHLRLPRHAQQKRLEPPTIGRQPGSKITFIPNEEAAGEPQYLNARRNKRQIQVQGGGSRGQGFDLSAQAQAKLWESRNKMNTVHGTGTYSQHLGGPYGNSRPNVGGGLMFTHRF